MPYTTRPASSVLMFLFNYFFINKKKQLSHYKKIKKEKQTLKKLLKKEAIDEEVECAMMVCIRKKTLTNSWTLGNESFY